jgi:hypothetical protein
MEEVVDGVMDMGEDTEPVDMVGGIVDITPIVEHTEGIMVEGVDMVMVEDGEIIVQLKQQ